MEEYNNLPIELDEYANQKYETDCQPCVVIVVAVFRRSFDGMWEKFYFIIVRLISLFSHSVHRWVARSETRQQLFPNLQPSTPIGTEIDSVAAVGIQPLSRARCASGGWERNTSSQKRKPQLFRSGILIRARWMEIVYLVESKSYTFLCCLLLDFW